MSSLRDACVTRVHVRHENDDIDMADEDIHLSRTHLVTAKETNIIICCKVYSVGNARPDSCFY